MTPEEKAQKRAAQREIGASLAGARKKADMTQTAVAQVFGIQKQHVSKWETGAADPGTPRLRQLAKLYNVSAESLLWDNAPSHEAMQLAARYDSLSPEQQAKLALVWTTFVDLAVSDEVVEQRMPITRKEHIK